MQASVRASVRRRGGERGSEGSSLRHCAPVALVVGSGAARDAEPLGLAGCRAAAALAGITIPIHGLPRSAGSAGRGGRVHAAVARRVGSVRGCSLRGASSRSARTICSRVEGDGRERLSLRPFELQEQGTLLLLVYGTTAYEEGY